MLPNDIICEIMLYLCIRDISRLMLVCKRFSKLNIWLKVKKRDYPLFADDIKDLYRRTYYVYDENYNLLLKQPIVFYSHETDYMQVITNFGDIYHIYRNNTIKFLDKTCYSKIRGDFVYQNGTWTNKNTTIVAEDMIHDGIIITLNDGIAKANNVLSNTNNILSNVRAISRTDIYRWVAYTNTEMFVFFNEWRSTKSCPLTIYKNIKCIHYTETDIIFLLLEDGTVKRRRESYPIYNVITMVAKEGVTPRVSKITDGMILFLVK